MRVAIVQKCPSNTNYEAQFKLNKPEIFNLCSTKKTKILKRDVDLDGFDPAEFDWVILVGSEALKMYTKATAVTDYTGRVAPGKNGETNFIGSISPAMLAFKPENKHVFDETVTNIHKLISGEFMDGSGGDFKGLTTTEQINEYLDYLIDNPNLTELGLDSETSDLAPRSGYVLGVCISHKSMQGVYADSDYFDEDCVAKLQHLIDTRTTVFHNAKFDIKWLGYHLGLQFEGRDVHDTMIMHYVLDERQGTHGLKSLTMKYGVLGDYDRELDEWKKDFCKSRGIKNEDFSYAYIPWDIMVEYSARDPAATLDLFYKFYPIIMANSELKRVYEDLLLPGMYFLNRMEERGVPISKGRLEKAKGMLEVELVDLKAKLYEFPQVRELEEAQGDKFNPNSTNQLRRLLFDFIGLKPTGKLTGTGAISTDAEVLKELGLVHEIPKLILDIRQKGKLKNTYIDKLLPVIDRDKRVRTGFNLTSTTSGRLSSSGTFNMQQLPRDNPLIKGCVVARPGYKIVAADLTTAEIYYAAVLSEDRNMKQVFINMKLDPKKYPDFHSNIAHMVFGLDCEPAEVKELYPALRQAAKAISFGINL